MPKVTRDESMTDQVVIAALKRATKVVEEAAELRAPSSAPNSPEPGTHSVSLSITVAGDVVVAEPAEVKAVEAVDGCLASDREILAAICDGMGAPDFTRLVRGALRKLAKAKGTKEAAVSKANSTEHAAYIASAEETLATIVEAESMTVGLWGTVTKARKASTRAGAVTGKPAVSVRGSIDNRGVEVSVEAGGGGSAKKAA